MLLLDLAGGGQAPSRHGRMAPGRRASTEEPQPEWLRYRIRIPHSTRRHPRDGLVLDTVHHVAHVPMARRILEDGRVRAGLVYDESRLNQSRKCVAWASANTWAEGSLYGNVQFTFAWLDILKARQIYWVEEMPDYRPSAYRLLLTDRNLGASRNVIPYDPATDKGPLRERDGVWYWNGTYTSEFMIESDLPLRRCTSVSFIKHKRNICRLHGSSTWSPVCCSPFSCSLVANYLWHHKYLGSMQVRARRTE
jgi:hypothetical protein